MPPPSTSTAADAADATTATTDYVLSKDGDAPSVRSNNVNVNDIWRDFSPTDRAAYQRLAQQRHFLRWTILPILLCAFLTLVGFQHFRIYQGKADCVTTYARKAGEHARCKDTVSRLLNVSAFFLLPLVLICVGVYDMYWLNRDMEEIVQRTTGSTQNIHIPAAATPPTTSSRTSPILNRIEQPLENA